MRRTQSSFPLTILHSCRAFSAEDCEALAAARFDTLRKWLSKADPSDPTSSLVRAELAFVDGNYQAAVAFAENAPTIRSRGRSSERARCTWRAERRLSELAPIRPVALASESASTTIPRWSSPALRRRASTLSGASSTPRMLEKLPTRGSSRTLSPRGHTHRESARSLRLRLLSLIGDPEGWVKALDHARAVVHLVNDVDDPFVRTSFWSLYTNALADAGYPHEGQEAARNSPGTQSRMGWRSSNPGLSSITPTATFCFVSFTERRFAPSKLSHSPRTSGRSSVPLRTPKPHERSRKDPRQRQQSCSTILKQRCSSLIATAGLRSTGPPAPTTR